MGEGEEVGLSYLVVVVRFSFTAIILIQTWYELLSNLSLFCKVGGGSIEL